MTSFHYHSPDAEVGGSSDWGGQLPLADLVHLLRQADPEAFAQAIEEPDCGPPVGTVEFWPSPAQRAEWAIERTLLHGLGVYESAVLKHVAHRAGLVGSIVRGCLQAQEEIGRECGGICRKRVLLAFKRLTVLRLLVVKKQRGGVITSWPNSESIVEQGRRHGKAVLLKVKPEQLLAANLSHAVLGLCPTDTGGVSVGHTEHEFNTKWADNDDDSSSIPVSGTTRAGPRNRNQPASVGHTSKMEMEIRDAAEEFPEWLAKWNGGIGAFVRWGISHPLDFHQQLSDRRAARDAPRPTKKKFSYREEYERRRG